MVPWVDGFWQVVLAAFLMQLSQTVTGDEAHWIQVFSYRLRSHICHPSWYAWDIWGLAKPTHLLLPPPFPLYIASLHGSLRTLIIRWSQRSRCLICWIHAVRKCGKLQILWRSNLRTHAVPCTLDLWVTWGRPRINVGDDYRGYKYQKTICRDQSP